MPTSTIPSPEASLLRVCDNAGSYPQNVAPRLGNRLVLQSQEQRLRDNERRIFRANQGHIHVIEGLGSSHEHCTQQSRDGASTTSGCAASSAVPRIPGISYHQPYRGPCVQTMAVGDMKELKQHLEYPLLNGLPDATSRHVFIHARSNKSQLMCSADMFKYLASYQEMSPDFLKLVHSLGKQIRPAQSEHFGRFFSQLLVKDTRKAMVDTGIPRGPLTIDSFNRSGNEFRCFYQLNGIELGEADKEGVQEWSIRQTTVYHSFDINRPRQFWMTIKANSQIRQRFEEEHESEASGNPLRATELQQLDEAFKASLSSHLLHLEWCVEGWRFQIDEQEVKLRPIIEKIQDSPVSFNQTSNIFRQRSMYDKSQADLGASAFSRLDSWLSRPSRNSTFDTSGDAKDKASRANSWLGAFSRRNTIEEDEKAIGGLREQPLPDETAIAGIEAKHQEQRFTETEGIFRPFSVGGYQELTAYSTRFQDIKLAIDSNIRVLGEIRRSYTDFMEGMDCPDCIKAHCTKQTADFVRRVNSMEAELQNEYQRLDAMISQLQEVKPLYESILQYRNNQANEALASHSRHASLRMEAMGERTERLTSSMHVITTFTLLLLPGTFLGSLFSTDIISRGDTGVQLDFVLGSLFLKICLPMMVISLIAWVLYVIHSHRRANQRKVAIVQAEQGVYQSEKQKALGTGQSLAG